MNLGLKKYLENIIGDNITRKIFRKVESGRTGAVRAGLKLGSEIQNPANLSWTQSGRTELSPGRLELAPRCTFQKQTTDSVRADWSQSGRTRFLLEGPKSVQCSEINFN